MTDFRKAPGAENRTVADKLGADMTRALMTAPGKSLPDAVRTFESKTGRVIHNPLAQACGCAVCLAQMVEL
jgi:hypothetical protein